MTKFTIDKLSIVYYSIVKLSTTLKESDYAGWVWKRKRKRKGAEKAGTGDELRTAMLAGDAPQG